MIKGPPCAIPLSLCGSPIMGICVCHTAGCAKSRLIFTMKCTGGFLWSFQIPISGRNRPQPIHLRASLILPPTLCTVAGVEPESKADFDGDDLTPILADPAKKIKDSIFFTYDDQHSAAGWVHQTAPQPNHIRCIRDDKWKYGLYFDPSGAEADEFELYDLTADPFEMNNVAGTAAYAEQQKILQTRLEAEMAKFNAHPAALPDIFGLLPEE